MARIAPYDPESASEIQKAVMAQVPSLKLFRLMAHAPEALVGFAMHGKAILTQTSLDPCLRELVILAVAHSVGSDYELNEHERIAQEVGCSREKVEALRPDSTAAEHDVLTENEQAACAFARECIARRRPEETTFQRVRAFLSDQALVELVLTIAYYQGAALFISSFDIEVESPDFEDNVKLSPGV
jgi:alkylhydroperoxidase family enzyme